jgi:hypothetical protein
VPQKWGNGAPHLYPNKLNKAVKVLESARSSTKLLQREKMKKVEALSKNRAQGDVPLKVLLSKVALRDNAIT